MRTELVFFDTTYETKRGTLRAITAMGFFIMLWFLWYGITMENFYKDKIDRTQNTNWWIGSLLTLVVLITAIGVQLPKDAKTALFYGALIGTVVYGFLNGVLLMTNNRWTQTTALIDFSYGIISTTIVAFMVYKLCY